MNALTVDIRKKVYANGTCAIENLGFSAQPGEFVAIVGPSGAGKTTLLKLIAGLDQQLDGTIAFNTGDGTSQAQAGRPRTGFMFQEPRLIPWLTVQQNLELVLAPQAHALQAAPDSVQLQDLLAQVGLQQCGPMFPNQLSGGMQRRVALLRAFIIAPDLLLMDEPFQSLDAPTADQLRALLQDLWQRTRPTVLFVTHSLREALSLADRVLFLSVQPSRIILDLPIDLLRPRTIEDVSVQQFHTALLDQYPQLLEGLLKIRNGSTLNTKSVKRGSKDAILGDAGK